jgi:hypothetical protein
MSSDEPRKQPESNEDSSKKQCKENEPEEELCFDLYGVIF